MNVCINADKNACYLNSLNHHISYFKAYLTKRLLYLLALWCFQETLTTWKYDHERQNKELMYSPEIIECSSSTPDYKASTPQISLLSLPLRFGYQKPFLFDHNAGYSWVLPDYRSLKDFKEFLTHFDFMWGNRWGRDFVVSSQFIMVLKLSTWALKLRTDIGEVKTYPSDNRHTSGGIVGHTNPIFCLHAFVLLKCGTVVVAATSNLHSRWCQQLFHEKKNCNYWQYNFILTQNCTSLLFRPLICKIL